MELLFIWIMCPVAAAAIACAKGRSGFGWFLLGLLLGIFAVIIVACLPSLKQQSFVMANPDGTATMIQPATRQRPPNDWVGVCTAIAIVFGLAGVFAGTAKVVTHYEQQMAGVLDGPAKIAERFMRAYDDSAAAAHAQSEIVLAAHDRRVERKKQLQALHDHPALVELRASQASGKELGP